MSSVGAINPNNNLNNPAISNLPGRHEVDRFAPAVGKSPQAEPPVSRSNLPGTSPGSRPANLPANAPVSGDPALKQAADIALNDPNPVRRGEALRFLDGRLGQRAVNDNRTLVALHSGASLPAIAQTAPATVPTANRIAQNTGSAIVPVIGDIGAGTVLSPIVPRNLQGIDVTASRVGGDYITRADPTDRVNAQGQRLWIVHEQPVSGNRADSDRPSIIGVYADRQLYATDLGSGTPIQWMLDANRLRNDMERHPVTFGVAGHDVTVNLRFSPSYPGNPLGIGSRSTVWTLDNRGQRIDFEPSEALNIAEQLYREGRLPQQDIARVSPSVAPGSNANVLVSRYSLAQYGLPSSRSQFDFLDQLESLGAVVVRDRDANEYRAYVPNNAEGGATWEAARSNSGYNDVPDLPGRSAEFEQGVNRMRQGNLIGSGMNVLQTLLDMVPNTARNRGGRTSPNGQSYETTLPWNDVRTSRTLPQGVQNRLRQPVLEGRPNEIAPQQNYGLSVRLRTQAGLDAAGIMTQRGLLGIPPGYGNPRAASGPGAGGDDNGGANGGGGGPIRRQRTATGGAPGDPSGVNGNNGGPRPPRGSVATPSGPDGPFNRGERDPRFPIDPALQAAFQQAHNDGERIYLGRTGGFDRNSRFPNPVSDLRLMTLIPRDNDNWQWMPGSVSPTIPRRIAELPLIEVMRLPGQDFVPITDRFSFEPPSYLIQVRSGNPNDIYVTLPPVRDGERGRTISLGELAREQGIRRNTGPRVLPDANDSDPNMPVHERPENNIFLPRNTVIHFEGGINNSAVQTFTLPTLRP